MSIQETLKSLLDFDPETGVLRWKKRAGDGRYVRAFNARLAGKVAGRASPNGHGYLEIYVLGRLHRTHRLIWMYVHGRWPVDQIDHIDGNKANNAVANLREATASQNNYNAPRRTNNLHGYKGVTFHKASNLFHARIQAENKTISLGYFRDPKLAHAAYCEAAATHHGSFARTT